MKLVTDAKNFYRWHSTYVFAVLAIFPTVWLASPELQAMLPPQLVSTVAPFIAALGFILRLRQQALKVPTPKPHVPPDNAFHQREDKPCS